MRIEGYRIWIVLFIAIVIVSGYLYYSVEDNQRLLDEQSIRSLELTRDNLLQGWESTLHSPFVDIEDLKDSARFRETLEELLDIIPPSDFFDYTVLVFETDTLLISEPQLPVQSVAFDSRTATENRGAEYTESQVYKIFRDDKLFRVPLTLSFSVNNQSGGSDPRELSLFGIIREETYTRARWQISFATLYILTSLIILLIVSFPLLRVFGLGRGDTLTRSHVYQAALSLFLLAIFIGFSISYLTSRHEIIENQHESIKNLSGNVEKLHKNKLSSYFALLDSTFSEETLPPFTIDTIDVSLPYNEWFQMDSDGDVIRMATYEPVELTIGDIDNLSERAYFRGAVRDTVYFGSHLSYADGRLEGVISRRENDTTGGVDRNSIPFVRAVTFNFDAFDRADSVFVNPMGLKYLIMNGSGEVFYQSPSITTVIPRLENVIRREEWREIETLMRTNKNMSDSLDVNVSFEGRSYVANLRRMHINNIDLQNPLWMLSLRDKNMQYFRSYAIFMYSAAGYFILFLLFLLISMVLYLTRTTSYYLNIKTFLFFWLKPSEKKRKYYFVLLIIIVLHVLCLLYIFQIETNNFWFILLLFCEVIAFLMMYSYVLLSGFLNKLSELRLWIYPAILFVMAVIFVYLIYLSLLGDGQLFRSAGILFTIQLLGLLFIPILDNKFIPQIGHYVSKGTKGNAENIFAFTFTLCIVVAGLLPGYIIHHTAFHYENELWKIAEDEHGNHNESHSHENNEDCGEEQKSFFKRIKEDYLEWEGSFLDREDSITNRQASFFDRMEYQRRQWLVNYPGLEYPVIDRYMYPEKKSLYAVFDHDHKHEVLIPKFIVVLLFIAFSCLLYLIIRVLTRRIFLTHYRDFKLDKVLAYDVKDRLFLITLDNRKAIEFMESVYFKNMNYNVYDLSRRTVRERLPSVIKNNKNTGDGLILLNVESAFYSAGDLNNLIDIIKECEENKKNIALTGARSIKESRDLRPSKMDHDYENAMINWFEVTGSFITIILPIHYGIDLELETHRKTGLELIDKLKKEFKFEPHYSTLFKQLDNKIDKMRDEGFDEKDYEKYLLIVQRNNKAYYQNVWEKLSFRERQMVYNYANEGFVNYCNFDILTELLQKGIFRWDAAEEEVVLFNQSFRNFATGAASPDQLQDFKKDRKDNGNLNHLRNAVLAFLFLAILGISLIAPDVLNRYIGAASGGLALLSTLASFANKVSFNLPFSKSTQLGEQG